MTTVICTSKVIQVCYVEIETMNFEDTWVLSYRSR